MSVDKLKNILILKRDKLGDLILTSFLIDELARKYPDSKIDLWVSDFTKIVYEESPLIHRTYPIVRIRRVTVYAIYQIVKFLHVLGRLRSTHYDLVIVAGGEYSPRAIKQTRFLRFSKLLAYCPSSCCQLHRRLTHSVDPPPADMHEATRMINLLRSLGIDPSYNCLGSHRPSVAWSPVVDNAAKDFLLRASLLPGQYAVIGMGARKAKRQPTADQVIRWSLWFKTSLGLPVILSFTPRSSVDPGYPNDEQAALNARQRCPSLVLLGGSLEEAIGVIRLAKIAILPDSGLMHAATTGQTKVLGLFADTENSPSPNQWGPVGAGCLTLVAQDRISDISDSDVYKGVISLISNEASTQRISV